MSKADHQNTTNTRFSWSAGNTTPLTVEDEIAFVYGLARKPDAYEALRDYRDSLYWRERWRARDCEKIRAVVEKLLSDKCKEIINNLK